MSEEKKVGKRYNQNKLRWRNIPSFLLEDLVKVGQMGEEKYGTYNFLKGLHVLDTMDSLKRHLNSLESPFESDTDPESGMNHAFHISWNALVLGYLLKYRPELDDRLKIDFLNLSDGTINKSSNAQKEENEFKPHKFKFEKLDVLKIGSLIGVVQECIFDENMIPKYILRTKDGQIFTEKESNLEMYSE